MTATYLRPIPRLRRIAVTSWLKTRWMASESSVPETVSYLPSDIPMHTRCQAVPTANVTVPATRR